MNVDAFTKGIKRATAQRKQQQAKTLATAVASINIPTKPATRTQAAKPFVSDNPAFNYEAYRLDIIAKAVAYISKLKGATQ